ncbi:MAG: DUF6249 domain-containing protein [Bacteroidales bacterium]
MDLEGLLIPLGLFAMIYGIVYLSVRKKERLALIESGQDAKIFNKESNVSLSLKFSLLLIGLGIGAMVGHILEVTTAMAEGVSYFSMILVFGGIGLLTYYFLAKNKAKE